jgi:hypothetical protein
MHVDNVAPSLYGGLILTVGIDEPIVARIPVALEMIESGLEGETGILCLKFNGWRVQGFEDAKIALIEGIVTGLVEQWPALTKAAGVLKDVFSRIDWLKLARRGGGLALMAFTGIPTSDQIQGVRIHCLALVWHSDRVDPFSTYR